jgi:hypothetical protein
MTRPNVKWEINCDPGFPTCWDGVNLDSPDHREHVAYPASGTFESGGACPSTHPVRLPQILLETVWDTKAFNNKADWPVDGSQVRCSIPKVHVHLLTFVSPSHGPPATLRAGARTLIMSSGGRTIACRRL